MLLSFSHNIPLCRREGLYMDKQGVIRLDGNRKEVALFGANYWLASVYDFRAADYVSGDRKQNRLWKTGNIFKRIKLYASLRLIGELPEYGS